MSNGTENRTSHRTSVRCKGTENRTSHLTSVRCKRRSAVALLMLILAAMCAGDRAAHALDDPVQFLIIQPGSPGSSDEAAPLMTRLADYLAARVPGRPIVKALYVNTPDAAERAVRTLNPRAAIVTLPYYLEQRVRHRLQAKLISRPGGRAEDHYHLLVSSAGAVADWRALHGEVAGTLCFTADAASRLLFGRPASLLPFHCQPTDRLLRASRQVVSGELAGLIVTDEQYGSLMALPEGKSLKELLTTGPLPPPLVVTFEPQDGASSGLTKALLEMKNDPTARALLAELRTDGFTPVDPAVIEQVQSDYARAAGPTK